MSMRGTCVAISTDYEYFVSITQLPTATVIASNANTTSGAENKVISYTNVLVGMLVEFLKHLTPLRSNAHGKCGEMLNKGCPSVRP